MKSSLLEFACSAALALAVGTGPARSAEKEAHILATKSAVAVAGYKFTTETISVMKDGKYTFTSEDEEIEGKSMSRSKEIIALECLSPTRFRRIQTTLKGNTQLEASGETIDTPHEDGPITGIPVILDKLGDGSYTAKLEKGDATVEQKKELEEIVRQADSRDDLIMYGEQPRKPGDKWDVDVTKLTGFAMGENLSGTMAVEFVEVKEFAGVRCAVLKSTFDLSGTMKDEESGEGKMTLKGEELLHRCLADWVDLDSRFHGRVTVTTITEDTPTQMVSPITTTIRTTLTKPEP